MYEFFYDVLQPSLNSKYMDLSNLDTPIRTSNKVPGKFKHELGRKSIEEFIVLKPIALRMEQQKRKE